MVFLVASFAVYCMHDADIMASGGAKDKMRGVIVNMRMNKISIDIYIEECGHTHKTPSIYMTLYALVMT
jgi:hypothetical protein